MANSIHCLSTPRLKMPIPALRGLGERGAFLWFLEVTSSTQEATSATISNEERGMEENQK